MASSCTKDTGDTVSEDLESISIPEGFNWENSREVSFTIGVSDARFEEAIHVISIYDADPLAGGSLIARGAASLINSFNVKLALRTSLNAVYIVKTAPDGTSVTEKVEVNGTLVSLSISSEASGKAVMQAKSSASTSATETPCTRSITVSGDYNLGTDNEVVCVSASNITVGFNFNASSTVRITGNNVRINYANLNNNSKLIISSGVTVSAGSINLNSASTYFENNGTVTFDGGFSLNGILTNNGNFAVNGNLDLNSSGTFTNNGTITVSSSFQSSSNNSALNGGKITTNDSFRLNSGTFINNCFLYAKNEYHNNGTMRNYGYVRVDRISYLNSGELGLYNTAMFSSANLTMNTGIRGYGTASLVKVSGVSTINSGAVSGNVVYCDQNGIETNYGTFSGGAKTGCDLYIPVSSCNTEGNGTAPIADRDGDKVADAIDQYPDDPTKAFNNYYPSNSANAQSTLAFEDTWPSKGDYDLNDVVIGYRYMIVTDANNKVVQVNATYNLIASGGTNHNGFGVEFPVKRSDVADVTGGTLETGQDKAVVLVFSDSRNEQSAWNTIPGEPTAPVKTYNVSFNVTSKPLINSFGLGAYNPFIWNHSLSRGVETHLAGKAPTALANTSLFGTQDDRTGSGKYYVTATGLPWAIDVPQSSFSYPAESKDISKTYLYFARWAASGGTNYTDWYSNTASGYRQNSFIYK